MGIIKYDLDGESVELVDDITYYNGEYLALESGCRGHYVKDVDEYTIEAEFYVEAQYRWVTLELKSGQYRMVEDAD